MWDNITGYSQTPRGNVMALSDAALRCAKPKDRLYKMFDGGGLFIEITPTGSKRWRFRYRRPVTGRENLLSLGLYPDVSLKAARAARDEARALLALGIDPGEARKADKRQREQAAADSFEVITREWITRHLADKSHSYRRNVIARLQNHVIPYLGNRPVSEITPPEVLDVIRRIERLNKRETSHKCLQYIGQICRYAIATGRRTAPDPVPSLRGTLLPIRSSHMPAPTDPESVGAILRMLDAFTGSPVVAAALRLLPLVFVRPGELRKARWADIDLDSADWRYTTSKTRTDHLVPLSRQSIEILKDLHPLTAHLPGGWVFPGGRSPLRPMSDMAINAAYRRMGIDTQTELTGHGWRAVARTLLHERLGYAPEIIEHQLAHAVPDALGRAYNRTRFLDQRREMMQVWADYLDDLR